MGFTIENFIKLLKFGIVGGICFVLDFSITYILKEKFKTNKFLSNSIGFFISAILNFFLNKYWTFTNSNPDIINQFIRFIIIASIGLAINNLIIYLLNEKYKINFYVSKLIAVFIVMFYNFSLNILVTFK